MHIKPPFMLRRYESSIAIVDSAKRIVAYVYFRREPHTATAAGVLSPEEAEIMAQAIARMGPNHLAAAERAAVKAKAHRAANQRPREL
jgi:hypothetical protein